jgi:hypothetical protein
LTAAIATGLILGLSSLWRMEGAASDGGPRVNQLELEFAWRKETARELIGSWGDGGAKRIRRVVYWDFPFIAGYVLLLSGMCLLIAKQQLYGAWLSSAGPVLAAAAVGAGILDAVENVALLRVVSGSPSEWSARVAYVAAATKWCAVSAPLLYSPAGVLSLAYALLKR